MTIRPPEFEVDPEDPFQNDTLARKRRVEALCRLIMDQQDAAVVSISGGFGTASLCSSKCVQPISNAGTRPRP